MLLILNPVQRPLSGSYHEIIVNQMADECVKCATLKGCCGCDVLAGNSFAIIGNVPGDQKFFGLGVLFGFFGRPALVLFSMFECVVQRKTLETGEHFVMAEV